MDFPETYSAFNKSQAQYTVKSIIFLRNTMLACGVKVSTPVCLFNNPIAFALTENPGNKQNARNLSAYVYYAGSFIGHQALFHSVTDFENFVNQHKSL